jgi:hypothetical protein
MTTFLSLYKNVLLKLAKENVRAVKFTKRRNSNETFGFNSFIVWTYL